MADSHDTSAARSPGSPAGDDGFVLPVDGFKGTPEEIEQQWYEQVYRGRGDSMAQLTWRAVLMGSLLGGVLCLTNIYMGLKTGWAFGVAITACILSYAIWTTLYRIGIVRSPMTILENNCMQSTASAAGYSTGGTLISAFAAYMILDCPPISTPILMTWVFFLAILGVTMAIPMKRQMINHEQLRFPSGIAAAETLEALHSIGAKGMRSAIALAISGLAAGVMQFFIAGLHLIRETLKPYSIEALQEQFSTWLLGKDWVDRTVIFTWEPVLIAAGALTGFHVCASMFVSAILCWAVFVPAIQAQGITNASGFTDLVQWTLWGGAACMVTSGLLSLVFQWRAVAHTLRSFGQMFRTSRNRTSTPVDRIEAPMWWFAAGQLVSLVGLATLAKITFDMPVWQCVVAVGLSFVLALIACRVTGETDTTPVGPMGKVTQIAFGLLHPNNIPVNLMSANITAGAASSSADLLTDLKSGYLLGANPRQQFLAQFSGIFIGTVVSVLAFKALVPDVSLLTNENPSFPAPSAKVWAAVAQAMSRDLASFHAVKIWAVVIGATLGIILPLLALAFPKYRKWIPSAAGVGLAWVIPWSNSLMFFAGAVIALIAEKTVPKQSEEFTYPVASGIIAGGSLMGVIIILWENGPLIIKQLMY